MALGAWAWVLGVDRRTGVRDDPTGFEAQRGGYLGSDPMVDGERKGDGGAGGGTGADGSIGIGRGRGTSTWAHDTQTPRKSAAGKMLVKKGMGFFSRD